MGRGGGDSPPFENIWQSAPSHPKFPPCLPPPHHNFLAPLQIPMPPHHFIEKSENIFTLLKVRTFFFIKTKTTHNIFDKFVRTFLSPPYVIKVTPIKNCAIPPYGGGGQYLNRPKAKEKPSGVS